jgi:hypothetical protein
LVTARQQLRKKALLGNGWPQQYQGRVFCGVRSQAINPRAVKSEERVQFGEISRVQFREIGIENGAAETTLEIESGVHRVGDWIIEIISCNLLKCVINPVDNPIPRLRSH